MLGLLGGLTGCTRVIAGYALPATPMAGVPMSASHELGDYSTIDPCPMVDTEGLPTDLAAEIEPTDAFDYCALRVDSAGAPAEVDVGGLIYDQDDSDETGPQALPSGLKLYIGSVQQDSCAAYLKFAEAIEMTSVAYASDGGDTSGLCTTAATVARNVSGVLARGPVPHRSLPANSFARIDPCRTLTHDTLDPLGLNSTSTRTYPAHHECDWNNGVDFNGPLTVHLALRVGPPPAPQQNVGTETQIGGRDSVEYVETDGSAAECWIDTGGPVFGAQQNLVEIAEVYVSDDNTSTDAACQVGTTLAAAVWPKLPSGS